MPTKQVHFAENPFIQPEELLEKREQPALALELMQRSAASRAQ